MVSYVYQMPSGIPGAITRPEVATIEAAILNQTTPPTAFGVACKIVSATLLPITTGDSSSAIQGVLVRPYPTTGNGTDGLGVATPNKALPGDLLKRGYINVLVNNFAVNPPSKQSPVYVRTGNASTGKVIGNFEAAPEFANTGTAHVGNTGNGTISAVTASQTPNLNTPAGTYTAKFTAATTYNLVDANGDILGAGVTGTAFVADNGIGFTITAGGTAFVAGDYFTIVIAANTILCPFNTYFTGPTDSLGNGEIAFNI